MKFSFFFLRIWWQAEDKKLNYIDGFSFKYGTNHHLNSQWAPRAPKSHLCLYNPSPWPVQAPKQIFSSVCSGLITSWTTSHQPALWLWGWRFRAKTCADRNPVAEWKPSCQRTKPPPPPKLYCIHCILETRPHCLNKEPLSTTPQGYTTPAPEGGASGCVISGLKLSPTWRLHSSLVGVAQHLCFVLPAVAVDTVWCQARACVQPDLSDSARCTNTPRAPGGSAGGK